MRGISKKVAAEYKNRRQGHFDCVYPERTPRAAEGEIEGPRIYNTCPPSGVENRSFQAIIGS